MRRTRSRKSGDPYYLARVTVTFLCLGALVANIMVWGAPDGLIFGLVPTVASGMIWLTPGPLPSLYCMKCHYDLRGLSQAGDAAKCPECGTPRGRVHPSDAEAPSPIGL